MRPQGHLSNDSADEPKCRCEKARLAPPLQRGEVFLIGGQTRTTLT